LMPPTAVPSTLSAAMDAIDAAGYTDNCGDVMGESLNEFRSIHRINQLQRCSRARRDREQKELELARLSAFVNASDVCSKDAIASRLHLTRQLSKYVQLVNTCKSTLENAVERPYTGEWWPVEGESHHDVERSALAAARCIGSASSSATSAMRWASNPGAALQLENTASSSLKEMRQLSEAILRARSASHSLAAML